MGRCSGPRAERLSATAVLGLRAVAFSVAAAGASAAVARRACRKADARGERDGQQAASPPTSITALKHAGHAGLRAVNLALTSRGLQQLEVGDGPLWNFSVEFLEGMAPKPDQVGEIPRRTNVLGDLGESSPESWEWGGWANGEIDGMLMLFAANTEELRALVDDEIKAMADAADPIIVSSPGGDDPRLLQGRVFADQKEHFGYTDGISQPIIERIPEVPQGRAHRRGQTDPFRQAG